MHVSTTLFALAVFPTSIITLPTYPLVEYASGKAIEKRTPAGPGGGGLPWHLVDGPFTGIDSESEDDPPDPRDGWEGIEDLDIPIE